ncbi:glycosyltransferase family 2 protein [Microbacterium sp. cf332]|uniref:glycosyltransferase family 2 protein n=1 Tax=Microbacterium sp. cf332 TaxID=1761804 RepID=UPI00089231C6|nr:glycosyltransferase [Microbacterium sp. cf332]SDQ79950.1 Glycosyltransferase, GT2 family [Microbacterium sp. cf332]
MPARVHALLVVRPDGRAPAAFHLSRTLAALREQTRAVDALTIVLCGGDERIRALAEGSGAEAVITAPTRTGFAAALRLASRRIDGDAVWLLAQDVAPEPDALRRLAAALETAPSVAVAVPKTVEWDDRTRIVSLGRSMTRLGAAVGLADGEHDQGQHDGTDDVLGGDVRGVLVHTAAWRELDGLDTALAGADEGLDLGVRVRLAGGRVVLAPGARIAVAHDGVAGAPAPRTTGARARATHAARVAQLHRRLVYAAPPLVVLHWLTLLPLALWRSILDLVGKRPSRIGPEWTAALTVLFRVGAVARARSRIARHRRASWAQLAPLRVGTRIMRQRLIEDEPAGTGPRRTELGFFSGGGAWAVLAALVVSVASLPAALSWPSIGGGGLAPLAANAAQAWTEATGAQRPLGWDAVGPADPFSAVLAVLATFSPADPSRAVVVLWLLALPLAVLGGWFAATRVTERPVLRIVGATAWALAPMFLIAWGDGRPAAVIVHLLLPWLAFTAAAAHRSWGNAGTASILLAAVLACSPVLSAPVVVLWLFAVALSMVLRGRRAAFRWIWVLVPSLALSAPLVVARLQAGDPWSLLADPSLPWSGPRFPDDVMGRVLLAAGFPADAGWEAFTGAAGPLWWLLLFTAPVLALSLAAASSPRRLAGIVLLAVAGLGTVTAFAAAGVAVAVDGTTPITLWPGTALSLAWIGVAGAALLTLDSVVTIRAVRTVAASVAVAGLVAAAAPVLTAQARDASLIGRGDSSTLPAFVAAEGAGTPGLGTIVLTPTDDGVAVDVVWGGSATLGGQSTLVTTRTELSAGDSEVAQVAADLVADTANDVVAELRDQGVAFILLAPGGDAESATARATRLAAATALDGRDGLDAVGSTDKGELWRLSGDVAPRDQAPASARAVAATAWTGIAVVFAIALLLALPTRSSRSASRAVPRVVGTRPLRRRDR